MMDDKFKRIQLTDSLSESIKFLVFFTTLYFENFKLIEKLND